MNPVLESIVKTVVVYFAVLVIVRVLGKREIGNLGAFDFLVALMIGEGVDEIIFGNVPLFQGLVVIGVIGGLHYTMSWAGYKNRFVERWLSGRPTVLVRNGHVIEKAMAEERISPDELASQLREQEIENIRRVKKATLEPDGSISVLKK